MAATASGPERPEGAEPVVATGEAADAILAAMVKHFGPGSPEFIGCLCRLIAGSRFSDFDGQRNRMSGDGAKVIADLADYALLYLRKHTNDGR